MSKVLEIIRERIRYLEKDMEEAHEAAAKWSMYEFDEDANPYYDYMDKDEAKIKDLKELESYLMEDEKKLEAFEIIKKKNVDVGQLKLLWANLKHNDDEDILNRYNCDRLVKYKLNTQEYNILKEVLWNEHN